MNPPPPEPVPSGGLPALLQRWGFSRAGWLDNRHGEWWLLAQVLLLLALLLPPWPAPAAFGLSWPLPLRLLGGTLVLVALVLALQALRGLGASLTPLPEPMVGVALVTDGPYRSCRHPLYRAILIGALGMALLLGSALHLADGLALALVLGGKARREERALLQRDSRYAAYQQSTAAILPGLPWLDWRA